MAAAGGWETAVAPLFTDAKLLDALSDGLVIVDAQDTIRFINKAVEHVTGRSRADLIGQHVWEAFPEALGLPFFAHYHRVQSDHAPAHFETYYPPLDLWLEARLAPLGDGGVIANIWDISARKHLEEELRESEERFRATFEQVAIGIAHSALDGQILRVNDHFCALVGRSREDVLALNIRDLTAPEDADEEYAAIQRLLAGEITAHSMEKRYLRPDGSAVWGELTLSLARSSHGEPLYLIKAVKDISERKRLEEALAARASELQAVFDAITDGVFVYRPDGTIREANAVGKRELPIDLADYTTRTLEERMRDYQTRSDDDAPLPPEGHPVARILRGETLTGDATVDLTYRLPDGSKTEANLSGAPIRDARGQIIGGVAVWRDVTERRRLEAEVAARAAQLQAIFDAITDWIWVYDADWRIVEANAKARDTLPTDIGAYSARPVAERAAAFQPRLEDGKPTTAESWPFAKIMRGETLSGETTVDRIIRLPDGSVREVSLGGAPIRDAQGRVVGAVAVAHDVTEAKQLERQRLDILRNVAHDLGNPLGAMKLGLQSYSALQRTRERLHAQIEQEVGHAVGQDSEQRAELTAPERAQVAPLIEREARLADNIAHVMELLNDAVTRMERLVENLNTAIRLEKPGGLMLQRAPFDLAEACRREARVLQDFSQREIMVDIPPESLTVEGDMDVIRRVIANLLSNADKYSPVDRPITLTLTREANGAGEGPSRGRARVAITDQGPGIPEGERERIWEQFHRIPGVKARDVADGLGLGLAICRGIINESGGQIGVESVVGAGSTFWFMLPLTTAGRRSRQSSTS